MSFRLPDNGVNDDVDDDTGFRTAVFDWRKKDRMRGNGKNLMMQSVL